jgi:hypothetical protein
MSLFYKTTNLSEEINRSKPFPSVRVPWFQSFMQMKDMCRSVWATTNALAYSIMVNIIAVKSFIGLNSHYFTATTRWLSLRGYQ